METFLSLGHRQLFFSANNGSEALGKLGLFHTALIFKQGNQTWTLEFDNAATSTGPPGAGYYPEISHLVGGKAKLEWKYNAARWCLTNGLMWGRDHWKKTFDEIATITPKIFEGIFTDVIAPINSSVPSDGPFYNIWHVRNETVREVDVVQDITCGNGAIWVRDYLLSKGVVVKPGQKVTRVHVTVQDATRVGPLDDEWDSVVKFYSDLSQVFAGTGNMIDKMLHMFSALPLKFAFNGNNITHPYLKLHGLDLVLPEKIRFEEAPTPWGPIPGPDGPIPAPPVPTPPVPPGPYYGKPTKFNGCQPGEEVFQLPISDLRGDGAIAKVCAPQCVGGPPDGICPDAPANATGFWSKPNCNNPNSILPGSDCVLRCMTNVGCNTEFGAECFIGPKQIGKLGICMYRIKDQATNSSDLIARGLPVVSPWNAIV